MIRKFKEALWLGGLAIISSCSTATTIPDKPVRIVVAIVSATTDTPDARLPLSFDATKPQEFTIHLKVINLDGSVRTSFDGPDAWVRLSVSPGQIVQVVGPAGA